MKPDSHILQALARARFQPRFAQASTGTGQRRSRDVGSGMDFADYREYAQGDDTRHIDTALYARHGKYFVRQFEVERRLPALLVVDNSASMLAENGMKLALARWLASVMGFVGLAGDDEVWLSASGMLPSGPIRGVKNFARWSDLVSHHLNGVSAGEPLDFLALAEHCPHNALVLLISDFWIEDLESCLAPLGEKEAEIWAFHLQTPREADPSDLPNGALTLDDAESGESVDIAVTPAMLADYAEALEAHVAGVRDAVTAMGGRHLLVRTDADMETFILRSCRENGLIR